MRDLTFRIKSKDHSKWIYFTIGEILPAGDVFTLGQFTGCHDKKGVAIYEGDIVRKRTYGGMRNCPVYFKNGTFLCGYGGGSSTSSHPYLLDDSQILIVGNIYDDPEMTTK